MTVQSVINKVGDQIVGILEERPGNRLILIVHGEQGHKDTLYQPLLAQHLPFSSFRFDLHGNGDSDGQTGYNHLGKNTNDIEAVADHFQLMGYEIFGIVAFGRGALSGIKYAATCKIPLKYFINISAPYYTKDNTGDADAPENKSELDDLGYFGWKVYRYGEIVSIKTIDKDVRLYKEWDHTHVNRIPKCTNVLTCHGINNQIIPVSHATMYANTVPTHQLQLFEETDHWFTNQEKKLVTSILQHFDRYETDAYLRATMLGQQHVSVCMPRWIDVEGVVNFRDIGGWPTKNGLGYVRERMVFRSGHLVNLTEKGLLTLRKLNVATVFDFRSDPEIERQGSMPKINGIACHSVPPFTNADYTPAALANRWKCYFEGPVGFSKIYADMLEKGASQYRKIFLHMLQFYATNSSKPFIVHCTAGKDRTGVFCMLLLGLCDVDDEIIANEYAMSNIGYWESEEELSKKASQLSVTVKDMRMVMSSPYLAMKETLRYVKMKYGNMQNFVVTRCQLTEKQVHSLRDMMVVPIAFSQKQLYRETIY